jgi:hypothetical protein
VIVGKKYTPGARQAFLGVYFSSRLLETTRAA